MQTTNGVDQRVDQQPPVELLALTLLQQAAAGLVDPDLPAQLARAVLDEPAARLALQVAAGGDHSLPGALELALLIRQQQAAAHRRTA